MQLNPTGFLNLSGLFSRFLEKSVQSKLANEKFVANATPEIIENERKKEADALSKIATIEQSLAGLK